MAIRVALPKSRWLYGGSLLYLVSAACVLVGILKIVTPVYADGEMVFEKLYALVALHVYELALLAVTLLVLLWRRVVDDAVALVMLVTVFIVGSAVALDTISPDMPVAAMWFGLAGLALAAGKVATMHRLIVSRFKLMWVLGIGLLLTWNFLMPALMGIAQANRYTNQQLIMPWAVGWCVTLIAAGVIVIAGAQRETPTHVGTPLLHAPGMRWIVVSILLVATFTHQYALSWAFGLRIGLGDFLPVVMVLCVFGVVARYAFARPAGVGDCALLIIPLLLGSYVIGAESFTSKLAWSFAVVSYPPLTWLAMAGACAALLIVRRESRVIASLVTVYFAMGLGFLNVDLTPAHPHWMLLLGAMSLALAIQAIAYDDLRFLIGSGVCLAAIVVADEGIATAIVSRAMDPWYVAAGVSSSFVLGVYTMFPRRLPGVVAFAGAVMLTISVMHCCFRDASQWHSLWWSTLIVMLSLMVIAAWTRDALLLVPAAIMLLVAAYIEFAHREGWLWIGGSFLFLAVGAVVSLLRGSSDALSEDGSPLLHPPSES